MIGLDTNVIVRFVVHDDQAQAADALAVLRNLTPSEPGYISHVVLAEVWWVLGRSYKIDLERRCLFVADLLDTAELRIEGPDIVRKALARARDGADLADALISQAATEFGCRTTITFDRGAVDTAGMTSVRAYLGS